MDDPRLTLRKALPKITGGLIRMRDAAYDDGAVPARYKLLAALVLAANERCEPCIAAYARQAREAGASQQELVEFLGVLITMGGCVGEEWALKALAAFEGVGDPEGCCD